MVTLTPAKRYIIMQDDSDNNTYCWNLLYTPVPQGYVLEREGFHSREDAETNVLEYIEYLKSERII